MWHALFIVPMTILIQKTLLSEHMQKFMAYGAQVQSPASPFSPMLISPPADKAEVRACCRPFWSTRFGTCFSRSSISASSQSLGAKRLQNVAGSMAASNSVDLLLNLQASYLAQILCWTPNRHQLHAPMRLLLLSHCQQSAASGCLLASRESSFHLSLKNAYFPAQALLISAC